MSMLWYQNLPLHTAAQMTCFYTTETPCKAALMKFKYKTMICWNTNRDIFRCYLGVNSFQREFTEPKKKKKTKSKKNPKHKTPHVMLLAPSNKTEVHSHHPKILSWYSTAQYQTFEICFERGAEGRIWSRAPLLANICLVYAERNSTSRRTWKETRGNAFAIVFAT